jgi:hypothetical protein
MTWSRFWAVTLFISTVAVSIVSIIAAPEIVRAPITLWFLAICPGMAIVRLVRLGKPTVEIMLALALSLSLVGLIPAILLYLKTWSPAWSLTALVAITTIGWVVDVLILRQESSTSFVRDPTSSSAELGAYPPEPTPISTRGRSRIRWPSLGSGRLPEDETSAVLQSVFDVEITEIADGRRRKT